MSFSKHNICYILLANNQIFMSIGSLQSSTELEALEEYSTVVPDTYLMQDLQKLERPKAASVTSAVLAGVLRAPSGLKEYEVGSLLLSLSPSFAVEIGCQI